MNTDKLNQQQLFGEPQYVEGTAGKKQVFGEPQYVTGREKHAEQLTPLYTEPQHGLRNPFLTDQEQLHGVHNASNPFFTDQEQLHGVHNATGGGDWQKTPVYSEQLYPGQEQFLGKNITHGKDGKEHLTSGGTFQTGEHTRQTEHLGLSPDKEHVQPSTPHVHLNPSEHVRLPPDAEHVHIKLGTAPEAGVEQVIRIKSDGRVLVNAEKVGEHGTEHLREHGHGTEHLKEHGHGTEHLKTEHVSHDKEKITTEHKKSIGKEHGHGKKEHGTRHKDYDPSLAEGLHKPRSEHETEHLHTQESKKKRLSDKGRHHDKTTETQTVVKVKKHEPGTAGRTKERKHDTK